MPEIIVGVDGSEHSLTAVSWAAATARCHGLPLRVVYAIPTWLYDLKHEDAGDEISDWLYDLDEDVVERAVAAARRVDPRLRVTAALVPGGAAGALIEVSKRAEMIVLAGRGRGEAAGLLLGSVTLQAVSHAACPVVVVRAPETEPHREIVVGVDGLADSQPALAFGFEEASRRGARLRAVHAWTRPAPDTLGDMLPLVYDLDVTGEGERRLLSEAIAGWADKYPDVQVVADVVRTRPVRALVGASAHADLLVVGSRGRGGFAGLLLGSVSHALLHRSECPLVVVPS